MKSRIEQSCGPVVTNPWSCSAEQCGQSTLEGTLEDVLWCGVEDVLECGVEDALECGVEDALECGVEDVLECGVEDAL